MSQTNIVQRLRLPVPEGVPAWQPDESATECFLCDTPFTIFFRRHHCRKCGKVVCGNCSKSLSTYPPSTYVVSPPRQIFLESPHVPHRTCDRCMEDITRTRSQARASRQVGRVNSRAYDETLIQVASPIGVPDDTDHCPICGKSLKRKDDVRKEEHIRSCVERAEFSGSPDQHRRNTNRMVVHELPEKGDFSSLGECSICFEDYKAGEKVGRLECLCLYHERCILDWFSRKGAGACPVHAVHM